MAILVGIGHVAPLEVQRKLEDAGVEQRPPIAGEELDVVREEVVVRRHRPSRKYETKTDPYPDTNAGTPSRA